MGFNWHSESVSQGRGLFRPGRILLQGVRDEMSPDPVLLERLERHGQAHLLRCWGELDAPSRASVSTAEIAAIDFDRLDRPDRGAGARKSRCGRGARAGPARSTSSASPRPTASACSGFAPRGSVPMRLQRAKSRSSWSPAAPARGLASKVRRAPFPSARSLPLACSRSTPRRSSPWENASDGPSRSTS